MRFRSRIRQVFSLFRKLIKQEYKKKKKKNGNLSRKPKIILRNYLLEYLMTPHYFFSLGRATLLMLMLDVYSFYGILEFPLYIAR